VGRLLSESFKDYVSKPGRITGGSGLGALEMPMSVLVFSRVSIDIYYHLLTSNKTTTTTRMRNNDEMISC